jgi:hypothetical protein
MRRMASNAATLRLIIAVLTAGASGAGLTACIHLPPAVAAEMQPAAPPASNHYRKLPAAAEAPQHAAATP